MKLVVLTITSDLFNHISFAFLLDRPLKSQSHAINLFSEIYLAKCCLQPCFLSCILMDLKISVILYYTRTDATPRVREFYHSPVDTVKMTLATGFFWFVRNGFWCLLILIKLKRRSVLNENVMKVDRLHAMICCIAGSCFWLSILLKNWKKLCHYCTNNQM